MLICFLTFVSMALDRAASYWAAKVAVIMSLKGIGSLIFKILSFARVLPNYTTCWTWPVVYSIPLWRHKRILHFFLHEGKDGEKCASERGRKREKREREGEEMKNREKLEHFFVLEIILGGVHLYFLQLLQRDFESQRMPGKILRGFRGKNKRRHFEVFAKNSWCKTRLNNFVL